VQAFLFVSGSVAMLLGMAALMAATLLWWGTLARQKDHPRPH
jgi:hypothetical protein